MNAESYGSEVNGWSAHQSKGGYFKHYWAGWIWISPVDGYQDINTTWNVSGFIARFKVIEFQLTGSFAEVTATIDNLGMIFSAGVSDGN